MSARPVNEGKVDKSQWQENSYQEELQLNLEELATSVTELVQVLSPLVQQAQDLTEAVGEQLHLAVKLTEIVKSQKAKRLASQHRATGENRLTLSTKD